MLTRRRQDFTSYRVSRGAECPANTDPKFIIPDYRTQLVSGKKSVKLATRIDRNTLTSDKLLQADYAFKLHNQFSARGSLPDDVEKSWIDKCKSKKSLAFLA